MTIFLDVFPLFEPKDSIFFTTSMPSLTWPNTTCLPSSLQGRLSQVRRHAAPWPPSTEFTKGTNSYGEPQTQSLIKLCELPRRTPADAGLPGRVLSPLTWRLDLNLGDLTYEK